MGRHVALQNTPSPDLEDDKHLEQLELRRDCKHEVTSYIGVLGTRAQYFTGEEAPATPAEDQATVYRYSYVKAADEILHEDR